jgi:hypothetical protein
MRRARTAAVIVIALVIGVGAWLILKDDDGSSERAEPVAASTSDVRELEGQAGHPVYWVGPREGTQYEVTHTGNGNVYIRYLPQSTPLGDERPNYLTVGSYPFQAAYATLRKSARQGGAQSGRVSGGGIYVVSRERPNSVYVAYPGSDIQIEVFSPSASQARRLVTSGKLRRTG